MSKRQIEVLTYCEEVVSTDDLAGTQVKKVIAVLPNHVWVYILTYTIEKGKRIVLPYECENLADALKFLNRAVETNNSVISYELFGDTVVKRNRENEVNKIADSTES